MFDLKKKRIEKGMTQQELADMIKKDRSLITKIENENTSPSVETAKLIASALGFPWVIFFEEERENNSSEEKEIK